MAGADIKEDWKKMQVRTFTNWFNSILAHGGSANSKIDRLEEDLKDGLKLVELLEILSTPPKKFVGINRQINHEQQKLENLTIVFEYLKNEAKIKTVNIGPRDVHKGDLKLILGLIWTLIQHFQIYSIDSRHTQSALLAWVNAQIPDQNVRNFTSNWNDGVALCALVDHIEPGLCPHYSTLDRKKPLENCTLGVELAKDELGVEKIIEPADLCDPKSVDFQSVMTYISTFCKPANDRLLNWVKSTLPTADINNLNTDWQNGVNLVGLLDALKPGGCYPNWQDLNPANAAENLTLANRLAKEHFGLEAVIDTNGGMDELSLATYLTHLQRSVTSPTPTNTVTNVVCKGPGLTKAFVGRSATFEIDATRAQRGTFLGDSKPSITITDSKNTTIEPGIKPDGKGKFQVEYTPWSTGKLNIDLKWKSSSVPGSPFNVAVIDMAKLDFSPKQNCIKVGDPIIFEAKGTSDFGDGDLDILLQDANGATDVDAKIDSIVPKSEGIVECSYKVTQPGKYKVVVKLAGVSVPGSPFQIEITDPQQYDIQLSETIKDGRLTLNKSTTFTVVGRNASPSCLLAKLQSPGASEPKEMSLSQHKAGSVSGKFTPTEGGVYKIHVTCAGENIPGSPTRLTATDPHRCFFDDRSLPKFVQVGTPCKVNVSTKGAGPGEVTVTSSQTGILAVKGEENEDCYAIEFIPQKIGESTVDVEFDGVSLPPTPHILSVCDASKCSASGEVFETGRAKCNEQFAVTVKTKDAGKGELTAKLMHGSKATCTRTLECNSDGTCNFPLMSYEAGTHSLSILWGGVHIPNSPFNVKVTCDATQFVAQGEGLREAVARRPAKFELKGPQSGLLSEEDMLQVKVRDTRYESKMVSKGEFNPAESQGALVCVTETKKGTYLVEYSVPAHGNFTIYVMIDDKPIPGSPFNVKVHPDPSQCKVLIEHPYSLVIGKSIEFKVDTTEAGSGELTVTAMDPKSSETKVMPKPTDWKNKVFELKVDPKVIGEHKIDVCWNNEHVPGSPFSFDICDPSKVKVLKLSAASDYSAEVGKPLTFLADPKKAGKGELKCTVKVKNIQDDRFQEIAVEPEPQDDGMQSFEFTPRESGQMQLYLTYNGESILSEPWECEIANPELTLLSSTHEKKNHRVRFKVSGLTKRVVNKLKFSVSHPRHKNPKIHKEQHQENGSITRYFLPAQLGKYDISVKSDGKDIHGSPLSVQAVNPEACVIKGEIPASVFLQQRKQFMINTSQAGPGELSCDVENQESNDQSSTPKLGCKITPIDPENAVVEVSGIEPGKCKLHLKWGGHEIPQMPVDVCIYDPSQCSCKCEEATINRVSVIIDTTKVGGCEPTVKARGTTTEYDVKLEKIGEGEYRASFTPNEDGCQSVEVLVADVMVANSPLTFETHTNKEQEDPHREISSPPSKSTPAEPHNDSPNHTYTNKQDTSVTFAVNIETGDTDTSQLHLKTVNPKKRYRVRVREEKSGEWKTTCSAVDTGDQMLQVLCSESEIVGRPIKILVGDQKKIGGLNYCKVVLAALLILLMLSVIATLSLSITDSEVRPY